MWSMIESTNQSNIYIASESRMCGFSICVALRNFRCSRKWKWERWCHIDASNYRCSVVLFLYRNVYFATHIHNKAEKRRNRGWGKENRCMPKRHRKSNANLWEWTKSTTNIIPLHICHCNMCMCLCSRLWGNSRSGKIQFSISHWEFHNVYDGGWRKCTRINL